MPKRGVLSPRLGQGCGSLQRSWGALCTFAPGAAPGLLPELPGACSLTLRKAEGDKVAEVLMGYLTPRFLQLQGQPHLPWGLAGWSAEKEGQVMGRVLVMGRFQCQSQEL